MDGLADEKDPGLTREDLFGKLAGKAKEAAGELVGNDDLARDGRQQQAEIEADAEAVPQAERAEPGVEDENPARSDRH